MTFRRANERLHDAVADRPPESPVPFLCECAAADCFGTVDVTLSEWEVVASQRNHFVMLAGHERSEGEEVVAEIREYQVAQKPD